MGGFAVDRGTLRDKPSSSEPGGPATPHYSLYGLGDTPAYRMATYGQRGIPFVVVAVLRLADQAAELCGA